MIDPNQPLEVQVAKQDKIIKALVERANKRHELGRSAYSMFQSAITLQSKVSEKTRDLEAALSTLGKTNTDLETAEEARNQTQQSLTDALESMDGGFALFTDEGLRVCNDFFRDLIPTLRHLIQPGLTLTDYFEAVTRQHSKQIVDVTAAIRAPRHVKSADPLVFELKNDRWVAISYRQTSNNNMVVLQTEITAIVRSNRQEKDRLIDAQEHYLKAAFDNMPHGVCTFSADGALQLSNARFASLLAMPIQLTRVGTSYAQIAEYLNAKAFVGDLTYVEFPALMRFLRRSNALHLREHHVDGTVLDLDVNALPDGGCIVNIVDVTVQSQTTEDLENRVRERTRELTDLNTALRTQYSAQARVEEDLRVAKAEVETAMTSKTRFFAAASHDLLQPINASKLLISSLSDASLDDRTDQTVMRLDRSFRSMETLLHALLDISRLESVDMKLTVTEFAIDAVMHNIVDDLGPLAAEKGLRLDMVPSTVWVRSDRRYLARCIQNLVNNAIQYTDAGRVLVGCRRRGKNVIVEVWDTGIGISKKDQASIFNEFTRGDPTTSSGFGMGLGLSIVRRACDRLGHPILLQSTPGVGSVFSITLPVVSAGSVRLPENETILNNPAEAMDLIIMMIENDPDVLFAMTQKLESWGASVLACRSTQEALKLVAEIGMSPDIILADYQLDGEDTGAQSILALRQQTGVKLPAIVITANQESTIKDIGTEHNFAVLTKPVNLSRLRPLIDWKTRHLQSSRPISYDQSQQ